MPENKSYRELAKKFSFKKNKDHAGEQAVVDKIDQPQRKVIEGEMGIEQLIQAQPTKTEQVGEAQQPTTKTAQQIKTQTTLSDEQVRIKEIESVLSRDLNDLYLGMDEITKRKFKEQGEDTARNIDTLLSKAKVKVKEVVVLIVKWLKIIPGVSKLFIEQEAKIKADKLMEIKRKRDGLE